MKDNQRSDDFPQPAKGGQELQDERPALQKPNLVGNALETLAHLGLGELTFRIGTNVLAIILVVIVVWLMQTFYHQMAGTSIVLADSAPAVTPTLAAASLPEPAPVSLDGIARLASLHTTIPSRPRIDVVKYTVKTGDTLFGIAQKYNLNPKTLLFGNYNLLKDDPHYLRPGQNLNILPVDGVYYQWLGTETIDGMAKYFGVDSEAIINYPGNHLDPDAIGDNAHPNIKAGTWLIVPGGNREFTAWNAPVGVTRNTPALARVMGTGSCGKILGGNIGYGTFIWPSAKHYLSGYDYSPDTNHKAIDISGSLGEAIFAVDAGVVVYAGWNEYGYGNLLMIDHGNGWQSLYAHLSAFNVVCGQSVGQGDVVGAIGSTGNSSGPHLHFSLINTVYGYVNPWNWLPAP